MRETLSLNSVLPLDNLTLLHIAAISDSIEAFIYLENNIQLTIDSLTAASYLPLHYAVAFGSLEIIHYILRKKPEQAKMNSEGYNLIFLGTCAGDAQILDLLFQLGANPALITAQQNQRPDLTAISQAIRSKRVQCLKVLLKYEAKLRNTIASDDTFIMLAIKSSQPDAVPLLLECGEDLSRVTREKHETALSLACFNQYESVVKLICNQLDKIDLNPNVNAMSAVHWACRSGNPEIVRAILAKNIDTNRLDHEGNCGPALILHASDEQIVEILNELVNHGFDINITNKNKVTLLGVYMNQIRKRMKVIDWLLMHGADPYMPANPKHTIMDTVKERSNQQMKDLFKKYYPKEFK